MGDRGKMEEVNHPIGCRRARRQAPAASSGLQTTSTNPKITYDVHTLYPGSGSEERQWERPGQARIDAQHRMKGRAETRLTG